MTEHTASETISQLTAAAQESAHDAGRRLNRAADELAHRSMEAMRGGGRQLRERARHAGDQASTYVRDEPGKSLLMAAAAGALLVLVVGLLGRSRLRD